MNSCANCQNFTPLQKYEGKLGVCAIIPPRINKASRGVLWYTPVKIDMNHHCTKHKTRE
jgi:hypothetical protein